MRLKSLISALASTAVVALQATLTRAQAGATGSLRLLSDESPFTFAYSTGDAADNNWVGLYDAAGGGPENEEFVGPSLKWAYAPGAEGTVTVSAEGLDVGRYRAFFLARDGYEWLAEPVDVAVERDPDAGLEFLVGNVTTHNARQGDAFAYSVAGLVRDGDADVVFAKRSCGPAWLDVGADGTISGTPGENATGDAQVLIRATRDGTSATIKLTIPVRPAGAPMVDRLRVLSFNMWMGGANVEDHHAKQVRFLATADVDVVGLQEDNGGGRDSRRLAAALGWHVWASGGSVAVLSRYPIAEEYGNINRSGGVRVALDGAAQEVNVFVVHLGYTPYGPYDFCFDKMPVDRVMEREAESGRTGQITDTLKGMKTQLAGTDSVPLLLLGDFNAPSHLDWIEELKDRHCGYWGVPWPTSVKPKAEGLVDSFRVANPDPVAVRGVTWSPIFLTNNGRPEPLDRIDFIYHKGDQLKVVSSEEVVVGKPKPQPNHKQNEWTSDHAAVLTEYELA